MSDIKKISGIPAGTIRKKSGKKRGKIKSLSKPITSDINYSFIPNVVTTNLIHYLDAGDGISYPGTGTIWEDLSDSELNGAFLNTPTYSSTDGSGSFSFDGVDDGIRFHYDSASVLRVAEDSTEVDGITNPSRTYGDLGTDGGFTIQCWVKQLSNGGNAHAFMPFGNNNSVTTTEASSNRYKYYQGIEITLSTKSAIIVFVFAGNGGNASNNRKDVRTVDGAITSYRDSWVNIAITIADDAGSTLDDNVKIYVQGSEIAASDVRSWNNYNEGTGGGLGYRAKYNSSQSEKYHAGIALRRGSFLQGNLSQQLIYADVLTASEILSNYNATKARYGY